jgi:hypothetical protein
MLRHRLAMRIWTPPYLDSAVRPEIQLLYKAKHRRPVDDTDFERVIDRLSQDARTCWLAHGNDRAPPPPITPGLPILQRA